VSRYSIPVTSITTALAKDEGRYKGNHHGSNSDGELKGVDGDEIGTTASSAAL
jgi:hypothetical protein